MVVAQTRDVNVDAARQCIASIQQNYGCKSWVSIQAVRQIDRRVVQAQGAAIVIAEMDLKVLQGFDGAASPAAQHCTGTYWDMDPTKVRSNGQGGVFGSYFLVGQLLRVQKQVEFQKFDSGWRCATTDLYPILKSSYLNNHP